MIPSLVLMATLLPVAARAAIGSIANIEVTEGALSAQWRNAYSTDDGQPGIDERWRSRIGVDYGFTDHYAAGLFVQTDNRQGDNTELEAVMLDQRFEIHDLKNDGFYSGFRVRYTWRDGDKKADDVHLRVIAGTVQGPWEFRFNQLFYYELGKERRDGVAFESRGQVTYGVTQDTRVGVENFSHWGFSEDGPGYPGQSHEIGPVMIGQLGDGLSYDASYRRGISNAAADNVFRFVLYKAF